ncbi:flippase [Haloarchaeobius sp. TZWSO28]|uniref:flippase n=1 Tax=Haloarchaeobius sp. TZWSO28 TaxID=3446119 RepID=UPI003EC112FB
MGGPAVGEGLVTDSDTYETSVLHSVTRGAGLSIGGIIVQRGFAFATNLLLTSALGVAAYGLYALGFRIISLLQGFAPLGSNPTLIRLLPKHTADPERQGRVLGIAHLTTVVTSLTLAGALFALAPRIQTEMATAQSFVPVLRTFALFLPLIVLVWQLADVFRAFERIEYQVLFVRLLVPASQLLAVALAFVLAFSLLETIVSIVFAMFAVFVVASVLTVRALPCRPSLPRSLAELREFFNFALPNSLANAGAVLRSRIDVLLVGALLSSEAAGIYNIALFLTGLIALPLLSINQLFPPVASRLYSDGDIETLQATYSTATRWIITAALLIAVYHIAFRGPLLSVFGPSYRRGELVLAVFAVGQVVNSSVGSAGWLLLMTDHQYVGALNNWLLGITNVALSYVLILEYGLIGAALGTAGSLAVVNCLRVAELWYLEGLQPYNRAFFKPGIAALVAAVVGTQIGRVLTGVPLLLVGAVTTFVVFVTVLVVLGPEPEDRTLGRTVRRVIVERIGAGVFTR